MTTPQQWNELTTMYSSIIEAMVHAGEVLKLKGMSSPEFRDADRETGEAIVRYRQKAAEYGVELYGPV